jgi:F-type H+-transporting ATPase subunit a
MAINPFEHVMDNSVMPVFETMHWEIHLPRIFGFQITRFMVVEVLAALLIAAIYIPIARRARSGEPPTGAFWNTFEVLLTFLRERVAKATIGDHDADRFVPFLWTVFLFVLFCNLLGMVPFLAAPTASLSVTATLALCSFFVIHLSAVAKMGPLHYMQSYVPHIDAPYGMAYAITPMIVVIEVIGQFIKTFVLAVRLFANMFAGHTVSAVILLFIVMAKDQAFYLFWPITISSVLGVAALSLLELFVAFLQAYIFTFLTALFIGAALHPQH